MVHSEFFGEDGTLVASMTQKACCASVVMRLSNDGRQRSQASHGQRAVPVIGVRRCGSHATGVNAIVSICIALASAARD